MQTMTVALLAPLPRRVVSATVVPSAPSGPVLPAALAPMLTLAGGGSTCIGIASCVTSEVLAALVPRKLDRVASVALVLAEYPVHFAAEVLEGIASQMDDAIPTTNAARLVLLGDNIHKSPWAVWHPLEHDDPAGAECILQFTGQELQFRLYVREPCDSRLRS